MFKRQYIQILGLISILLFSLIACKKDVKNVDYSQITSLQKWLNINGQFFSKEEISVSMGNSISTAKLDWNSIKKSIRNNDEFYTIPFVFDKSNTKSSRVNYNASIGESPSLWNLVLRIDKKSNIEGRFVISSFQNEKSIGIGEKKFIQTVYDLTATLKLITLKNNDDPTVFLLNKTETNVTSPAYNCEFTSFTTKVVDCSGTNQYGVVCTLKSRTTSRYRCEFSSNIEEEELQWTLEECGCGQGWFEYEEEEEEYENQAIIDSLDAFPCTQDILKQLPSFNEEARKLIDSVFGHNDTFNLIYSVNPALGKDSLLNGYFKPQGTISPYFFNGTIRLNPWVLKNSSREFIASTMLHESIHAVVSYWHTRYLSNSIDSNQFKSMFPLFWNYQSQKNLQELAEHNIMAENYVNLIKAFIKHINPSIDDSMAEALGWSGLHESSAWIAKPNKNTILNKIRIARRDLDSTTYLTYNLTKCPD